MTEEQLNLLHRYLDGAISEGEMESLEELLRNSEEARAELRTLATIDAKWQQLAAEGVLASDPGESTTASQESQQIIRRFAWPSQIAAGLVAGLLVGMLGVGVVWAIGSPRATARVFDIAHGDFESMPVGAIPKRFPVRVGEWGGNPAEVIEEAGGNRVLRLLKTGNVNGDPDDLASNCSVFQLVDLSHFRQQWEPTDPETQITLNLSARFRREAAPTDAALPKLAGSCRIYLFNSEPEAIGKRWPRVIDEDGVGYGKKGVKLAPGEESATITASCVLESDATVALIVVVAGTSSRAAPIELGGYYVDDVQLTAIRQPNLPVRFVE